MVDCHERLWRKIANGLGSDLNLLRLEISLQVVNSELIAGLYTCFKIRRADAGVGCCALERHRCCDITISQENRSGQPAGVRRRKVDLQLASYGVRHTTRGNGQTRLDIVGEGRIEIEVAACRKRQCGGIRQPGVVAGELIGEKHPPNTAQAVAHQHAVEVVVIQEDVRQAKSMAQLMRHGTGK